MCLLSSGWQIDVARNVRKTQRIMKASDRIPVECIAVIGLGYVGLSLASAFGRTVRTIGFDIDQNRIRELRQGHDRTGEASPEALRVPQLTLTSEPGPLQEADFLIVTVPTPVDRAKRPDLSHLLDASRLVARALKARHDSRTTSHQAPIVVYESTVYPGCTEEACIPVLEKESGLKAGIHFKVGYSPERINPGDAEHSLETIVKVVGAQDDETADTIAKVYDVAVKAGVYKAPDIRTAEAAKVIENIQRDLNIALMNELAMLFDRMGLSIQEVLKAARTKWNFLPFEPGLVGGHCIPVDPYYLTHKAQEVGYHPEVILAGRRINDFMGMHVARETIKLLIQAGKAVRGARVLVLGVTFKQDVRDTRNSRVVDLVRELESYGSDVRVHDPYVDSSEIEKLRLKPVSDPFQPHQLHRPVQPDKPEKPKYDAVILAVPHKVYREKGLEAYFALFKGIGKPGVLVDVKRALPWDSGATSEVLYWSL